MAVVDPTLIVEGEMHARGARFVIGCDEVGRGAIAGPVAVGLSVIDMTVGPIPEGLRDSKMLAEARRELLAPVASSWALFSAVGLASPDEIDRLGITACLGLAARRALTELHRLGAFINESVVLLDGHFDWLNPALATPLPVVTRVKADQDCASVAAASVIAKVHRDRLMIDRDVTTPGYGWARNKGYASSEHLTAIDRLGASDFHRRSWLRGPREAPTDALVEAAVHTPAETAAEAPAQTA